MKFLLFDDAKEYVHKLKLKNKEEWRRYCSSGTRPKDIPSNPSRTYRDSWNGWGDWLGTGRIANQNKEFLSFEDAREFVHSLNLKSSEEWSEYSKSKRARNIPSTPDRYYSNEWKGWGDWLGTVTLGEVKLRKFTDARDYVRALNLKNFTEWKRFSTTSRPPDIPGNPHSVYRQVWKGYGDWLGTGRIADQYKTFKTFAEARKFIHSIKLLNRAEWIVYCKSGRKPSNIPASPSRVYKKDWKGWGDWLGTGFIAQSKREYLPFEEARHFVHGLSLKSGKQWDEYCKLGIKPTKIPSNPPLVYAESWNGMGDWLGSGIIATQNRKYRSFEEAKEFVHRLNLKNTEEWYRYRTSDKKPSDIPSTPEKVYKKEWKGIIDWLGYEDMTWSVNNVKILLRDLIESKIIYHWDDAVLYSFLLRKGLLNLHNRHNEFFRNLVDARRMKQGISMIKQYAYSDSENPPELTVVTKKLLDDSNEIQTASNRELTSMPEADPLDY